MSTTSQPPQPFQAREHAERGDHDDPRRAARREPDSFCGEPAPVGYPAAMVLHRDAFRRLCRARDLLGALPPDAFRSFREA